MRGYLRTLGLFAALTLLLVGIGYVVGAYWAADPWTGMVVFLVLAAALNLFTYFYSDRMVLWMHGARIVTPEEAPRLHRMVGRLAAQADLPMPRIAVIHDPSPNAFATGRDPKHAVVAATTGILQLLDDDELAGVMAHELAHVQNRDILIMSAAATVAGAIAFAARSVFWGSLFGGDRGGGNLGVALLVAITAPIAAILVQLAISRSREYAADRGGARIHGNPLALARALQRLETVGRRVPMRHGSPATAHLYIVNPFRGGAMAAMFATHPPMRERIRRLEALAVAP